MNKVTVDASWDDEAKVWVATSADVPGLVVEAESWTAMVAEVPIVLDELLDVKGVRERPRHIVFKAEQNLDLAAA